MGGDDMDDQASSDSEGSAGIPLAVYRQSIAKNRRHEVDNKETSFHEQPRARASLSPINSMVGLPRSYGRTSLPRNALDRRRRYSRAEGRKLSQPKATSFEACFGDMVSEISSAPNDHILSG